jgi:hypothetical protein
MLIAPAERDLAARVFVQGGCPVMASDVPVHREVGGEFAAYFPSGDAAALAAIIARQQKTGLLQGVRPVDQFRWPDWTESCRELLCQVLELASRAEARCHTIEWKQSVA